MSQYEPNNHMGNGHMGNGHMGNGDQNASYGGNQAQPASYSDGGPPQYEPTQPHIMARVPDVSAADHASYDDRPRRHRKRREKSSPMPGKVLMAIAAVLIMAAAIPFIMNRSNDDTAGDTEGPVVWGPEAPAPEADLAPTWGDAPGPNTDWGTEPTTAQAAIPVGSSWEAPAAGSNWNSPPPATADTWGTPAEPQAWSNPTPVETANAQTQWDTPAANQWAAPATTPTWQAPEASASADPNTGRIAEWGSNPESHVLTNPAPTAGYGNEQYGAYSPAPTAYGTDYPAPSAYDPQQAAQAGLNHALTSQYEYPGTASTAPPAAPNGYQAEAHGYQAPASTYPTQNAYGQQPGTYNSPTAAAAYPTGPNAYGAITPAAPNTYGSIHPMAPPTNGPAASGYAAGPYAGPPASHGYPTAPIQSYQPVEQPAYRTADARNVPLGGAPPYNYGTTPQPSAASYPYPVEPTGTTQPAYPVTAPGVYPTTGAPAPSASYGTPTAPGYSSPAAMSPQEAAAARF